MYYLFGRGKKKNKIMCTAQQAIPEMQRRQRRRGRFRHDSSRCVIKAALVGNPNSGKTSLFNLASGAHEHVGNYGGVTVDSKLAGCITRATP